MSGMVRDCPGCGGKREFAQPHQDPRLCPDSADARCPEWFCVTCGVGLLIGILPVIDLLPAPARITTGQLDRVA